MIYFVGAGCGAADLITVRGKKLLERADIIIYAGSLVNPELLSYAGEDCKIYNSAVLTLDEVISIMEEGEKEQKEIVRLHTGDQSIYGAVKEQMERLDQLGISYESCPGVSACFGAAASLNLEYTLPGVSQSLIITRMEGKTAVPEKENIESMAAHQATMAIYLSTGMLEELKERLICGGYPKDTPAALVYKATWPEEKAVFGAIEQLPQMAKENGITKTALVLVGRVLQTENYQKSRLYAPDFETEFRKSYPKDGISIISFTRQGELLSKEMRAAFPEKEIHLYSKFGKSEDPEIEKVTESIEQFANRQLLEKQTLLFIGAAGIAVRAIAGTVKDKLHDSPVLVIDEKGTFVIPILSGHVGGANELAENIAEKLGAIPVITTATDLQQKFAVDVFAKKQDLSIRNREGIAKISSKILEGEKIVVAAQEEYEKHTADLIIGVNNHFPDHPLLMLTPREYLLGFGCKKGKAYPEMRAFIEETLEQLGILKEQVKEIVSIDRKGEEPCILQFSKEMGIPFRTFTGEELKKVQGEFSFSDFVKDQVGVDNVCERAAMAAAGEEGELILKKTAENGMTIAIAKRKWGS